MTAIYIAFRNDSRATPLANDGIELLIHLDTISAIGEECGLARLDDYIYMPSYEIAEFFREAGATDEEIEKANPVTWYPAEEGRELMQGYIATLNSYHSISETTRNKVIPELESFLEVFAILVEEGNEWHFEYDL